MSGKEEIRVEIGPEGEVSIEVRGVEGEACLELTEPLEEALGGEIVERRRTSEYYESDEGAEATSNDADQHLERGG